jgi:hypothetical protein
MTGSTPSDAYHIPTVLAGGGRGWTRVWIPVITAALVIALGALLVAATADDDPETAIQPPQATTTR